VVAAASLVQDGGWSARDEAGRKVPVARFRGTSPSPPGIGLAGGPFLEISIPPGDHDLILDYSPPGFRAGCAISFAALLVAAGAGAFARRARHSLASGRKP
jgi:uncharacterized membrane protein YfhO